MATNHEFDSGPEDQTPIEFPKIDARSNDPITPFLESFQEAGSTHIILVMPDVPEPKVFYGDSIVLIQGHTPFKQYEAKIDIEFNIDKAKTTYTNRNGVFEFQFFINKVTNN